MDAFKLLDSYADELTIVMPHNLVRNELESSILLEEVLQVQDIVYKSDKLKKKHSRSNNWHGSPPTKNFGFCGIV